MVPDAPARAGLQQLQSDWARDVGAPRVRLVPAGALHLTVRFFGATPATRVPALAAGVRRIAADAVACTAHLRGIEYWPAAAPRVVVAAFDAPAALVALAEATERLARELGFAPEPRPFRAHVTLARSRGGALSAWAGPVPALALPIAGLVLMRSDPSPDGPRYTVV